MSRMNVRSRNRVRISGRPGAPVVVLAHGFGCDQNMWRLVVPALERDFTVVLFDHVGSGRSDLSAWSKERYSSLERAEPKRSGRSIHGVPVRYLKAIASITCR
jgi:sigma-B regulation protein RsbQ